MIKQHKTIIFAAVFYASSINSADKISSLPTGLVAGTVVCVYLGRKGIQYTAGLLAEKAMLEKQILWTNEETETITAAYKSGYGKFMQARSRYLPELPNSWHENKNLRTAVRTLAIQDLVTPGQTVEDFFEDNGITITYGIRSDLAKTVKENSQFLVSTPEECKYLLNAMDNWDLNTARANRTQADLETQQFLKGLTKFIAIHREATSYATPHLMNKCVKKFDELDKLYH